MANSIEEVIYSYLTSDATFLAKFEGVYWQDAEDGATPYIVFWLVDDNGADSRLGKTYQGQARIQFDLWDSDKARGVRLRSDLRDKIKDLSETIDGYKVMCDSITEQTIPRESGTDPYHFVVDGIITWYKE